jgi:hypothetical protein
MLPLGNSSVNTRSKQLDIHVGLRDNEDMTSSTPVGTATETEVGTH